VPSFLGNDLLKMEMLKLERERVGRRGRRRGRV
jgi:hypothetical protein